MGKRRENAEMRQMEECGCELDSCRTKKAPWKWGTYLNERQWGKVREDYSDDGDAWNCLSHDQANNFIF